MKRFFACAAVLTVAGAFFGVPASAAVESAIVGYVEVKTDPGFNMLGVVFNGLDGTAKPLNEILFGDFKDGDEVQVYNRDSGYVAYSYWKDYGGWLDGNFQPATQPLPVGSAFWLKTPGRSVDVQLKGCVLSKSYDYEGRAGLQMVSPGLPAAVALNKDISWAGLTDGDELQIRRDGGYESYTYWKDYGGWLDGEFLPTDVQIPVGTSIWLNAAKAGVTMSIALP